MKKTLLLGACAVAVALFVNPPARAADSDAIAKAIEAGVAYLKQSAGELREGNGTGHVTGCNALVAVTLLECGVAPDDPVIKHAAEHVRTTSIKLTETYDIALAIFFLDKLGTPLDIALIESLTIRLLAGQTSVGAWSYNCPAITEAEAKRLLGLVEKGNELVGKREPPKPDDPKRTVTDLPKEIQDQLVLISRGGGTGNGTGSVGGGTPAMPQGAMAGDNSNTQFATLALWVARRHGLPVDGPLARVQLRFRRTIQPDGGWTYMPVPETPGPHPVVQHLGNTSSASMTCAGLLGLTVGYGVVAERADEADKAKDAAKDKPAADKDAKPKEIVVPDISKDPVVLKALMALSTSVGVSAAKLKAAGRAVAIPKIGGDSYYFLWSLERVCMAMDLDTLGGKDWYEWGSEILIANQTHDGSWQGSYANYRADTCFALLFLKRANLARDLSARMKGKLDQKALRGGVGGDALKEKLAGGLTEAKNGDKPGDSKEDKPAAEAREGERLAREVVEAKGNEQDALLAKLRDGEGRKCTDALLTAIPQLDGNARKGARKALAERFAKESGERLSDYLDDRDVEVRRAAALACALKESKAHVPQLIGLLRDREPLVSRAAWAALKSLTGQDFGPALEATDADKDKAVEAWRDWWKKNGK